MELVDIETLPKSRLAALLEHLSVIEDVREPWRVAHPLPEVLLLVVCGTICDCDDYDAIAEWGALRLDVLRRFLPYDHGVPGGRWLTILMNRIDPGLFQAALTGWVRETWPERPDLIAKACPRACRRQDPGGRQDPGSGPGQAVSPQPRSHRRQSGAASRLRLRHHWQPGARPGGGRRESQR